MSVLTSTTTAVKEKIRYISAPTKVVGLAIFVGWLFQWVFYDTPIGISALIFIAGLVVATLLAGRFEAVKVSRKNAALLVPLFFFTTMLFVRTNEFLVFINVLMVLLLLLLWAHFFSAETPFTQTIPQFIINPLRVIVNAMFGGFSVISEVANASRESEKGRSNMLPIVRGLLLALPILAVFTGLLGSADLIFAQKLDALLDFPDTAEIILRILLLLWIAWLAVGAMAYAVTRGARVLSAEQAAKVGNTPLPRRKTAILGSIETTIVLGLVNILFAAFVALQFVYLFGGASNISIDGYTYAEYARRGFFEMVLVAVLALGMILFLNIATKRNIKRQANVFNALSTLMLVFVTVMLVSAHQRLQLYEMMYGFTLLRLQSHTFILWLALGIVWVIFILWRHPQRAAIGLFICLLGFVAHLNIMNPDALIVRHNVARYQSIKAIIGDTAAYVEKVPSFRRTYSNSALDTYYLTTLSDDAIPELLTILDQIPEDSAEMLRENLIHRGELLTRIRNNGSWKSWHYTRSNALTELSNYFGTTFKYFD